MKFKTLLCTLLPLIGAVIGKFVFEFGAKRKTRF